MCLPLVSSFSFIGLLAWVGAQDNDSEVALPPAIAQRLATADIYVRAAAAAPRGRIDLLESLGKAQLREIKSHSDLSKDQIEQRKKLAESQAKR
jgi:hypothetical protein